MIEGNFMKRKLLYTLLSAALLSVGWYGGGGFTLLVALLPLLEISREYGSSARDWWRMAGWAAHRIEELIAGNRVIRPAYKSVAVPTEYIPLEKRENAVGSNSKYVPLDER